MAIDMQVFSIARLNNTNGKDRTSLLVWMLGYVLW